MVFVPGAPFVARRWYVTEVVRAANGVINEAAIVPPAHSPQVSDAVINNPTAAPAWITVSSRIIIFLLLLFTGVFGSS